MAAPAAVVSRAPVPALAVPASIAAVPLPTLVTPASAIGPLTPLAAPLPALAVQSPVVALKLAAHPAAAAELPALGRRVFDGALAKPAGSEAVLGSLSPVAALPARGPRILRALAVVPSAPALAGAAADASTDALLAAAVVLAVAALALLRRPRRRPALSSDPLPPAGTDLDAVREQTDALVQELFAAVAGVRAPELGARALTARWERAAAEGGVRLPAADGAVRDVPISRAVFEAIDLPQILGLLAASKYPRGFGEPIGELLRGLRVMSRRAGSTEEALRDLAWWKAHFRQFPS